MSSLSLYGRVSRFVSDSVVLAESARTNLQTTDFEHENITLAFNKIRCDFDAKTVGTSGHPINDLVLRGSVSASKICQL